MEQRILGGKVIADGVEIPSVNRIEVGSFPGTRWAGTILKAEWGPDWPGGDVTRKVPWLLFHPFQKLELYQWDGKTHKLFYKL